MVRDARTGKYRRTRLFVLTLGYSRKAVRLLTFHSSSRIWAELHEKAFRRLGGTPRLVVLDNLKEGAQHCSGRERRDREDSASDRRSPE
jgi:transposase